MSQHLPIFPLNLVVLPGEPVPLHIFESRYKQLLADCAPLAGQQIYQPFGINYSQHKKLNEIGCSVLVNEIRHKYPNGELDIMTYGQKRYRLLSTHQQAIYLTGEVEWIEDQDGAAIEHDLRANALDLYYRFLKAIEVEDPTLNTSSEQISFEIAYRVNLEKELKLKLLQSQSENERLQQMIAYLEKAIPEVAEAKLFRARVRANGYFA